VVAQHGIAARLAARVRVDVQTYERLTLEMDRSLTSAQYVPDHAIVPGHFESVYAGRGLLTLTAVRDYYRCYAWS
jgi:hypothetical protein